MNRFASTRSEKRASQPLAGRAQCRVGSIDEEGIRYGLTTQALIASTIAIAPAMVTIQSIVTRQPCGRPCVKRSTGFRDRRRGSVGATIGSGKPSGRATGTRSGSVSCSGSSGRSAYQADATARPVQRRS
jgi:hypothetical protein